MVLLHITEEIVDGIIDMHGDYLRGAKKLNLSSNGIRYIDDLSKLNEFLTKLDLSFNDLEEVKGLQSLSHLEELNLSGNKLRYLTDIRHLSSLESLDVSQNHITHLKDVQMLQYLPDLKVLKLEGNPICSSTLVYPYAVLAALPSVCVLDGKSREAHMSAMVQSSSARSTGSGISEPLVKESTADDTPQPQANTFLTSSHDDTTTTTAITASRFAQLQQQLAYAQAENAAYADMFRVAENSLGRSAPKDLLASSSGAKKPDINCILSYPYTDLLKLWRQKVHSLTLQALLDSQEIKSLQNNISKLERVSAAEKDSVLQTDNTLRSRLQAAEQLIAAQADELATVHAALDKSTARQRRLEHEVAEHKKQDQYMRKFLVTFRAEVDQQMVASNLLEVKLGRRISSFASRFAACQDRLQLLQNLNAQKDVQIRNTAAAFEAEKRLLTQWTKEEIRRHTKPAQSSDTETHESADVNGNELNDIPGSFANSSAIPSFSISAECEAFLRAVFRQLDPDDSGTVSQRLLLQCLHTAAARGLLRCSHSISGDSEVGACSRDRSKATDGQSTDIWAILIHGLEMLVDNWRSGDAENITWGEFLLLLCPYPQFRAKKKKEFADCNDDETMWNMNHDQFDDEGDYEGDSNANFSLRLSSADHRQLHHAKLLGDLDWAMIPLSLPSSAFNADESALIPSSWLRTVVSSGHNVEFDVSRLKKEALRLAKERAFLLRRVQSMSHSLERRAASIRSYFNYDLRKLTVKNESVQRSLRDNMLHVSELEERVQGLCSDLKQERNQASVQQEILTAQVSELQARLADASSREETSQMEKVLEEYQEKMNQTESELRIVRKELSKAALTHKTLQRDLKRHQATEMATQELMEDYKAKYKAQKRTSSALEDEQSVLKSRLATAEQALETIKTMQLEKQEADRKAVEEADRKAVEEADRKAVEEADRKAVEEADRKAVQEAEEKIEYSSYVQEEKSLEQDKVSPSSRMENIIESRQNFHSQKLYDSPVPSGLPYARRPVSEGSDAHLPTFHRPLGVPQHFSRRHDEDNYEEYLASRRNNQSDIPIGDNGTTPVHGKIDKEKLVIPGQKQQMASGLALESMARKLRMMADSLND